VIAHPDPIIFLLRLIVWSTYVNEKGNFSYMTFGINICCECDKDNKYFNKLGGKSKIQIWEQYLTSIIMCGLCYILLGCNKLQWYYKFMKLGEKRNHVLA
jgi:hypothetical protein